MTLDLGWPRMLAIGGGGAHAALWKLGGEIGIVSFLELTPTPCTQELAGQACSLAVTLRWPVVPLVVGLRLLCE